MSPKGFFSEDDETLYDDELLEDDKEEIDIIPSLPPLEGDEEEFVNIQPIALPEVREGKGLKISTPSKLLTRFPILLAQRKAENNSYKLKNEIRQIL